MAKRKGNSLSFPYSQPVTSSTCSQSAMKTCNKKRLEVSFTCAVRFEATVLLSYQRKKVLAPLKLILSLASRQHHALPTELTDQTHLLVGIQIFKIEMMRVLFNVF